VGDVTDVDDAAIAGADRQVVELFEPERAGVELDEILEVADLLGACRQGQGKGREAPCTVDSAVRMMLLPRSKISASDSLSLERASWMIGTLEAL
jgi:hypothetical protein